MNDRYFFSLPIVAPEETSLGQAAKGQTLPFRGHSPPIAIAVNKTDANDTEGVAHLARAGWYREVTVKELRIG
jgi:hypothetical protein